MEQETRNRIFCKKLSYGNDLNNPNVILGIITKEDKDFLIFKTDKKRYTISKRLIISILETEEAFRGDLNETEN